ncbi:fungal-specific transcription factor domain-containing protein [Aspergillus pseudonomiae]|nr:fungal-specific transcription factor domain-containing protein [Aspergillus pseudonomiae]
MSHPSPQKNGGNNVPPPKQIRFVSTDGQPQTKRRRVNAACRTCRKRKIRCSGEQPVCKTCSDYNHVCLGYSEPTAHTRSQSDVASRTPAIPPLLGPSDSSCTAVKVESRSPDSPSQVSIPPSDDRPDKSSGAPKPSELKDASLMRETSSKIPRDSEQHTVGESPESSRTSLSSSARTHVPYFRYFGPTAIVPGFKQMVRVVQVRGSRKSNASLSSESMSPLRSPKFTDLGVGRLNHLADSRDNRDANTIPFYDRDDSLPVSNLVTHLCDLFFVHLGCNFPFLQRERFLRDLKDKKIDTMLVDAVCTLSARFSPHPLLSPPQAPPIDGSEPKLDVRKSDRGQPFAHRAMGALVDVLSCPTLSVVQACLLLAYEEFGSNHDSGLWMYLGISIRMAQDLGMQKLQGLKYNYGQSGVTPNAVVTGQAGKLREEQYDDPQTSQGSMKDAQDNENQRAWERERVDTFWSIFFLDRVISSGTGRPVTLRDEDIELCFPLQSESLLPNGWPAPFPPLIRIIHLYGRVTDLINGIQDVKHVTTDTLKRLAGMESDLTGIYQRLSPRLHFNAANFQAYVKAKEGTNFILLHFWFHTLIVLLHQPTLLNSFGGSIQHLYPNSRELSMSSAKTIADILSFSELVDGKSFIGNPFTSQPMYIAACAFLMESTYYSPLSGPGSPPCQPLLTNQTSGFVMPNLDHPSDGSERKPTAKHILLSSAAKENYQRCYKALKALETYWEGTKYILTVLDQKAKGIVDPLLYTEEEMEGTAEIASVQPFAPGWRQPSAPLGAVGDSDESIIGLEVRSPRIDPSQAIGWALTGATNSSQPNLSVLYQMPAVQTDSVPNKPAYSSQYSHSYPSLPMQTSTGPSSSSYTQTLEPSRSTAAAPSSPITAGPGKYSPLAPSGRVSTSDASLLLGLNTSFSTSASRPPHSHPAYNQNLTATSSRIGAPTSAYNYNTASTGNGQPTGSSHMNSRPSQMHPSAGSHVSDILIESQDIDMASLEQQDQFPFTFNMLSHSWGDHNDTDRGEMEEHLRLTPTVRKHHSVFRKSSSVRAMQMHTEDEGDGEYLTPPKRRGGHHMSDGSSQLKRSSYYSPTGLVAKQKSQKDYPLVLLHCNLLPPSLPIPGLVDYPDQKLLREVLPPEYWRRWKLLEEKIGSVVLRERGVLISHPEDMYDLLEERLLESLELQRPRFDHGHFLGHEETDTDRDSQFTAEESATDDEQGHPTLEVQQQRSNFKPF